MAESCPSTNFRAWERERRSRTRRVELVGSVKQFLGEPTNGFRELVFTNNGTKCVVSLSIDQRFKPRHIEDYRSSWNHRAVSKEHMRTLQPPYTSGSNTPDPVPAPLTHCSASLPDEHADRCTGFQDVLAPNGRRNRFRGTDVHTAERADASEHIHLRFFRRPGIIEVELMNGFKVALC